MKLKPCPFCGGGVDLWNDNFGGWNFVCLLVEENEPRHLIKIIAHTEQEAIEAWNTRTEDING